jgi:predicted RNA-binding Zn-ribbon protein involved in translation (DUF1610 family)
MASGMYFDEEGHDVTMDVLSEAVETMDDAEVCPDCGAVIVVFNRSSRSDPGGDVAACTWPGCGWSA